MSTLPTFSSSGKEPTNLLTRAVLRSWIAGCASGPFAVGICVVVSTLRTFQISVRVGKVGREGGSDDGENTLVEQHTELVRNVNVL